MPNDTSAAARRSLAIGLCAAVGTALCGAIWQTSTRVAVTTALGPFDLAMLRYAVPGLVLLPLLLRDGLWPTTKSKWLALPLILGGGLLFGLPAIGGAIFAPVAHMGSIIPGTVPVATAVFAALILSEPFGLRRGSGFLAILIGVGTIAAATWVAGGSKAWIGDLMFLFAGLAFAMFTIAFRLAGLSPWHATGLIGLVTTLFFAPVWLLVGPERLLAASLPQLALQVLMQGVIAGMGAMWFFVVAVKHLGASRASLAGVLVPIFSTLGGALILGEVPALQVLVGIAVIMAGVTLASGGK